MRPGKIAWLGLAPILVLFLLLGLLWVAAGTIDGTRWLLGRAQQAAGDGLGWSRVEGTLLGSLRIEGLQLRQHALELEVASLEVAWRPRCLLMGELCVERIAVAGIRLHPGTSDREEPPSEPFNPADLDPPLDITLGALDLRDIVIYPPEGEAVAIDRVNAAARVQDSTLRIERLALSAPDGALSADGSAGLFRALPLDLRLEWRWRLPDGRDAGGDMRLVGDAEQLSLEHRGSGEVPVSLKGELRKLLSRPAWDISLAWPALAISPDDGSLEVGPGQLASSGDLSGFHIEGAGAVSGLAPGVVDWRLAGTGNATSLALGSLAVASGSYHLALTGKLDWAGPISADLGYRVAAERLDEVNPALPLRLDADGVLKARYEGDTAILETFSLEVTQAALSLDAAGRVHLPAGAVPELDGRLQWRDVRWPLDPSPEAAFASPRGQLQVAGTAEDWHATLEAEMAGNQLPPGSWRGDADGDSSGVHRLALHGDLLDGGLDLAGTAAWAPEPRWDLVLSGSGLNPGRWRPDLSGDINLRLVTRGRVEAGEGPRAELALETLRGVLAGRPFDASASASLAGETLRVSALQVSSGDNRVSASGSLGPEQLALDWRLAVPDPAVLLPGAGGQLHGQGHIGGSPDSLNLRAQIGGRDLAFDELALPRLDAAVTAGLAPGDVLDLKIDLAELSQGGEVLLDALTLAGQGTTADHRITLEANTPTEQLRAGLAGGLDPVAMSWGGELNLLELDSDRAGNWQLDTPARLALATDEASLALACLRPAGELGDPARICAGGDWRPDSASAIRARLARVSLDRWLPDLEGEVTGEVAFDLAPDGTLEGGGAFSVSPGALTVDTPAGRRQLAHGGASVALSMVGDGPARGLDVSLALIPMPGSQVRGNVRLPGLTQLPPAPAQALAGRLQLDLPDLGGLEGWLPGVESMAGRLQGDLRLDGTLEQPRLGGELALADAAADLPQAGLQLRNIQLRLAEDPARPGVLDLSGGLESGGGRVALAGSVDPVAPALAMTVNGERVEAYNTADARVLVSPDLRIAYSDSALQLRGTVRVPEARITPRLGISPGVAAAEPDAAPAPGQVIAPSADVVILQAEPAPQSTGPEAPLRLDSEIKLVLGDKVRVEALGFAGRIAGDVAFLNPPGRSSLIPIGDGRLSVEGGTFRAFGQDLEIETGEVRFRKTPVTEPEITLRAVRWINNDPLVSVAGIQVSGTLDTLVLALFSRPQVDPTEIQSYLLTGHSSASRDTALSIGTYLHPKLYVGYGYNLLEETSEFDALYTITPRYGLEANVGEADNNLGVTITYEH